MKTHFRAQKSVFDKVYDKRMTTGERQINDNKNNSTKFMTNISTGDSTGEQQINDNKNNSTKFMTGEQQANNR